MSIIIGDCLGVMRDMDDCSVDCCVTSPPYFALRDYGHKKQIGQEEMPEQYISKMTSVFDEVKRVLKKKGTLWLNIGDTYASNGTYINKWLKDPKNANKKNAHTKNAHRYKDRKAVRGGEYKVKKKDLLGIPWRLAFSLQSHGWYLRNAIVWNKISALTNPCKDRHNTQYEMVFLMSKSPNYYFDESMKTGDVWSIKPAKGNGVHFATFPPELVRPCILAGCPKGGAVLDPFAGSGTTGLVAKKENRRFIMIELNKKYAKLAKRKINEQSLFDE